MTIGQILDRVAYVVRPGKMDKNLIGDDIVVKDTYPYNPTSRTAGETARKWASDYGRSPAGVVELEVDNEPFDVTITDLELRGRGGRAYKVVDNDHRRFDLREDQLIEILKRTGIEPGGKVPGKFVWAQLGTQMHVVLVGGDLHSELLKETAKKKDFIKRDKEGLLFTEKNMVVDHIYKKKDGSMWVYLGPVTTPASEKTTYALVELPNKPPIYNLTNKEISYAKRYNFEDDIARRWDELTWEQRCHALWVEGPRFTYEQYKHTQLYGKPLPIDYYDNNPDIVLMSNPKFIEDMGQCESDFVSKLRENAAGKSKYMNGNGKNVVEELHEKLHGRDTSLDDNRYMYISYNHHVQEKMKAALKGAERRLQSLKEFRDALVWKVSK